MAWVSNSFTRWRTRLPHLSILCETNSGIWYARGGESIFYYQPAYRYMVFLQHLLLGDGDVSMSALSVAAVNGGIFFATCQFFRQANSLLRRFMILGVFFLILFLVNANQVLVALVEMGVLPNSPPGSFWLLLWAISLAPNRPGIGSSSQYWSDLG